MDLENGRKVWTELIGKFSRHKCLYITGSRFGHQLLHGRLESYWEYGGGDNTSFGMRADERQAWSAICIFL